MADIIQFPGLGGSDRPYDPTRRPTAEDAGIAAGGSVTRRQPPETPPEPVENPDGTTTINLTPDQAAAIQKVNGMLGEWLMGRMSLVFIGIRPTGSGADFLTVVEGKPEDLRNAHDHLPDVITRAYGREGL